MMTKNAILAKAARWALLIAACATFVLLYLRFSPAPSPGYTPTTKVEVPAPPKAVVAEPKISIPAPKTLKVYKNKAAVEKKLELPPETVKPEENIASVAETKPIHEDAKITIVSAIDNTGETRIITKQEVPFWQLKRDFVLEGRYLFVGNNVAEMDLKLKFLRTGPVTWEGVVGGYVERDGGHTGVRAGVGFEYKF